MSLFRAPHYGMNKGGPLILGLSKGDAKIRKVAATGLRLGAGQISIQAGSRDAEGLADIRDRRLGILSKGYSHGDLLGVHDFGPPSMAPLGTCGG